MPYANPDALQKARSSLRLYDFLIAAALAILLLAAMIGLPLGAFVAAVWFELFVIPNLDELERNILEHVGLVLAVQALAIVLAIEFWVFRRRGLSWLDLGWRPTSSRWVFLAGAFALVIVLAEILIERIAFDKSDLETLVALNLELFPAEPTTPVLIAIMAVVGPITAIGEECLFRGVLFNAIRRHARFGMASLLSSSVFAAMHFDYFQISWEVSVYAGVALVVSGIAFAWLYEKSGSLLPPITAHAVMNILVFIDLYERPFSFNTFA